MDELINYVIAASDGDVGRCKDFLFEDVSWVVRYMVADTRKWLPGRKVLVSPIAVKEANWDERRIYVRQSKEAIRKSPPLSEHEPVSRKYEIKWFDYYGWPLYWGGGGLWGAAPYPSALFLKRTEKLAEMGLEPEEETRLRSVREIKGYTLEASGESVGRVDDFIMDDDTWAIRYLLGDTGTWLSGKKFLLSPGWVKDVDWGGMRLGLDVSKSDIENSPEFDPALPVNRQYEERLYDFYGRPVYWSG
jgi:hypothetical protein